MLNEISNVNWVFATENYDDDFHTDIVFLRVIEQEFIKGSGVRHRKVLMKYNGSDNQLFFSSDESVELSSQLINRFCVDPDWRNNLHYKICDAAKDLMSLYENLDIQTLYKLSIDDIFSLYKAQHTIKSKLYYWGWMMETMSASENSIDKHLKDYLRLLGVPKESISIVFSNLLYCPELSIFEHERIEIQEIIEYCLKNNIHVIEYCDDKLKVNRMIDEIFDRYKYLYYHGYNNQLPNKKYYYKIINDGIQKKLSFCDYGVKSKQESLFNLCCAQYNLKEADQSLFKSYARCGTTKSIRRLAELKNFFYLDAIISIISQTFNISERTIRFMTPEEVLSISTLRDKEAIKTIEQRSEKMIYYYNGLEEYIITDPEIVGYIDETVYKHGFKGNIVTGTVVCQGVATGKVHIINKSTDIINVETYFKQGDILVSYEPNPDFIKIIRKCGAIVTDQGGMTCHVASIAKEFNIPCIVGTECATSVFSSGDYVTVDAYKGSVVKIGGCKHE